MLIGVCNLFLTLVQADVFFTPSSSSLKDNSDDELRKCAGLQKLRYFAEAGREASHFLHTDEMNTQRKSPPHHPAEELAVRSDFSVKETASV